jgi:putative ABC transport system permease protein
VTQLETEPLKQRVLRRRLDAFRAGRLQPGLVGESGDRLDTLRSDAIFLSRSGAQALGLEPGSMLTVQVGLDDVDLRVAGLLSDDATHQRLAVMDIGAVQWRFHRLGQLTRVDLRLRPGVDILAFQERLQRTLPPGVYVQPPRSTVESNLRLSRAYRTNLNVLALVALFAGGLLVFSTQVLAVLRRRSELALLRVLGVTRGRLLWMLAGESAAFLAVRSLAVVLDLRAARRERLPAAAERWDKLRAS